MNTYNTEITTTYVGKRTDDQGWGHHLWDVTLTRNGETANAITFPYRMGLGHEQTLCGKRKPGLQRYNVMPCHHMRCKNKGYQPIPPTLYDVLTSLKADCPNGQTFAEWCGNYGESTDSIKAQQLYFACQESEDRSRKFFGADWFTILEDEEYV